MGIANEYEIYPDQTTTVRIYANSGGKVLALWWVMVDYNTDYLSYSSYSDSDLWASVTVSDQSDYNGTWGRTEIYNGGIATGVDEATVNKKTTIF
jgi:hypothetical protein